MQIYVSPGGRDCQEGSREQPLSSIEKAAALARVLRKETGEGVTVNLEEGTYYLEKPLVFTQEDSGCENAPVVYRGLGKAVVSGGRRLYPKWEYQGGGIYRAAVGGGLDFDQFFVNGRKMIMARYPNYDENAGYFQGYSADCLSPERTAGYGDPRGGYIHAMHRALWGDMHYRIVGRTEDGRLEYVGGWQNNRPSEMHPEIRFIENVLEELDSPEEWFYDGREFLYYYPPGGEDMENAVYEAACLKNLVTVRGTGQEPVRHLTFTGITFRHARRTFMEPMEPVLRSDWCIYRGGAVFLEGTEHISFVDCKVEGVGGNGFMVSGYNRNARISGCEIREAGANAILFAGNVKAVRSPLFGYENVHGEEIDLHPGPASPDYPAKCTAEGNLIVRSGRVEKQSAGVSLSVCEEITVRHNTIYDVPRAGINICDGTWGGHLIEKNAVFYTVRETQDHGAFNSWGRDRYWDPGYEKMARILREDPDRPLLDAVKTVIIRDNIFECANGWDIDLDDGSSNYLITGNLCLRGGIKNREGIRRRVVNNVMLRNTFHPHVWFADSGDIFERNILFQPYAEIGLQGWGASFDYNLLMGEGVPERAARLQEKSGMDAHSLCGRFRFVCGKEEGFRIVEKELTERLGILPLDVKDCGVTRQELKEKALSAFEALHDGKEKALSAFEALHDGEEKEAAGGDLCEDSGMRLKRLEGLGEMSATGMYQEKGILVKEISRESKWQEWGFRERDVILSVSGQETETAEQALELLSREEWSAQVWREQQVRTLFSAQKRVPAHRGAGGGSAVQDDAGRRDQTDGSESE